MTELAMLGQKAASAGKLAILSVLEKAADTADLSICPVDYPSPTLKEYYTLTREERTALVTGDILRIQSWAGNLDRRLSTWLYWRLLPEK
ncbi:MAG TPA: hypothetical protein VF366_01675 [Dehalococcoidia bacterium]